MAGPNVNSLDTMLNLQGDRVLIADDSSDGLILTIIHVVDVKKRELKLVNRDAKNGEEWPLTQDLLNRMVPLKGDPRAKWKLEV